MTALKTLKLRIKDKHVPMLNTMAREVNQVFNHCNEISSRSIQEKHTFLCGYDLQKYTNGFSKCEGIHITAQTTQAICEEYATRRKQFKKKKLNWRVSNPKSSKRSLGWIPFKKGSVTYKNGQIRYAGNYFNLWDSYGLSDYDLRGGSFNQDSRGRWYVNIVVSVEVPQSLRTSSIGIDLGLKDCATVSTGEKLEGKNYKKLEPKLAVAQRARKKKCVKAIHEKIANKRKDELHKLSSKLVKENGAIFVGNVSSEALTKTNMAKSVLDAGWGRFKAMLEYKCNNAGIVFEVVNESYSTQTCSSCGSIEGPKGLSGLEIREWKCSCGVIHDRDINAALNIRAKGLCKLAIAAEGSTDETVMNEVSKGTEVGHDLPVEGIHCL